ncbi:MULTISPECIES: class II fructose-1,6-bisphosphate aldolase [Deinococcus]|jgi:fructose-bisphosphate aldolase class II|uniref:Fructose-bisphosphate aldolase class II n=2 Tax=Deinococcus soli (ex Cha et al. 2016) TaxID=1309411 RepID=A0A0F7JNW7_9DEIO|nr:MULTISPECIES: class II fructose-1,6-bisphosphate aldolase [Deinococcus]AKH17442.1 tagatose-bisphosphate aldolase [Deinococcus soli (ex Cha et al. 2016)]MDK2012672.1 class II fructose-1,6-bisphosphate aldolase [Deinococcus sp. 43]MDR6219312.1 fructose-bisphosphate aldolase class II [Deinococcus soli (ex Cha et al. 2016)]MDR6329561.1 fructose-bisphosphate aldolase class II [Deinococcus soli (ex Cha et al. 2016)]MDR6752221.1 fructose-bisphosphate aldolase class II [Deinococcus soli (ex Cha et 
MLVTGNDILIPARAGQYGVGSFNTNNMEITQAIIHTAERLRSPVMVQMSEGAIKYGGQDLANIVIDLAKRATVPVALHLDHGSSYESALKAIKMGFTSVMIDASHHGFEDNVKETKRVVEAAHAMGISVESELGRLGGIEEHIVVDEKDAFLTDPEEAVQFIEQTGTDYLAIAIGTSHGAFKGKGRPYIDHARIEKIASLTGIPLVAHGSSGVPQEIVERFRAAGGQIGEAAGIADEDLQRATQFGIAKVNVDTDLRLASTVGIREALTANPKEFDPRKIFGPARDVMSQVIEHKMRVLGSVGKA